MAAVLKTARSGDRPRGFESHALRFTFGNFRGAALMAAPVAWLVVTPMQPCATGRGCRPLVAGYARDDMGSVCAGRGRRRSGFRVVPEAASDLPLIPARPARPASLEGLRDPQAFKACRSTSPDRSLPGVSRAEPQAGAALPGGLWVW